MKNNNFKLQYEEKKNKVNQIIEGYLKASSLMEGVPTRLKEAMGYSLLAGGKRLRPVLVLLVWDLLQNLSDEKYRDSIEEAMNLSEKDLDAIALSLEMIHTYSLIHDDLPAMDDDDLRRGNPTCHIKYDEATAILAGDGLLNQSFELLSTLSGGHPIKVISLIAKAAGARGMIGGQMIDMTATGSTVSQSELEELHSLKTGCLITCAVLAPIAYCNLDSLGAVMEKYGRNIGLAFQVMDDVLEATTSSEALGKSASSDIDNDKSTFVKLMGIEKAKSYAEKLVDEACDLIDGIAVKEGENALLAKYNLKQVAHFIIKRGN